MEKITIAIDGYTGTGKGTTAKRVAKKLGYTYLDTGAMYRAVALYAIRHDLLDAPENERAAIVDKVDLDFSYNKKTDHFDMIMNGENVEKAIRETELGMKMKPVVVCIPLRKKLVKLQQKRGEEGGVVADGRDIGTQVFPDAPVKAFFVCDVDERVARRVKQLQEQGYAVDKDKIRKEIIKRDQTDYLGPDAVNKKADDAVVIDTTNRSINGQVEQVLEMVEGAVKNL